MRYLVERTIGDLTPDFPKGAFPVGSVFSDEEIGPIKNPRMIRSMLSLGQIRELAEPGEVPVPRRGPGRPRKE